MGIVMLITRSLCRVVGGRMPQSKEELDADNARREFEEETDRQAEELRLKRIAGLPDLEDLGPELDPDNPDPRAHIYFLIRNGTVVYVGETTRLGNRIRAHKNDKAKSFNSFKAIEAPLDTGERMARESLFIEKFLPEYNKL
jgi:ADP-ribose pyrophosphatase YjhB (NUDIX family)